MNFFISAYFTYQFIIINCCTDIHLSICVQYFVFEVCLITDCHQFQVDLIVENQNIVDTLCMFVSNMLMFMAYGGLLFSVMSCSTWHLSHDIIVVHNLKLRLSLDKSIKTFDNDLKSRFGLLFFCLIYILIDPVHKKWWQSDFLKKIIIINLSYGQNIFCS